MIVGHTQVKADRYTDKAAARRAVWDALTKGKGARFPFPVHGPIANFEGAEEAAERLLAHPIFQSVRVIKVNPDSPQRWVRKFALERNITVITPTPRLKGAFRKLDPEKIPTEHYDEAARLKHGGECGEDLPKVDLVVMGSVAVTRDGRRLGKGRGYADLEDAILRELGNPPVPVVTTVQPVQVLDGFIGLTKPQALQAYGAAVLALQLALGEFFAGVDAEVAGEPLSENIEDHELEVQIPPELRKLGELGPEAYAVKYWQ